MNLIKLLLFTLLISNFSYAQQLEEIVVTAQSIDVDYYDMPAVTLIKKADFLVQNIRLLNDSRSPDLRKEEIIKTIDDLINSSKRMQGIELSYGNGFLVPVNLDDDSLQFIQDEQRNDANYVDIFVKVALNERRTAKEQIADLRSFISKAQLTGRTEIISLGDIGLSIIGPEQYRYEILKKIAEENTKIKDILGGPCETNLGGLQGRVEWERSGIDELTLFIRYASDISCN